MKWDETEASLCKYANIAERIWGKSDIVWEHSDATPVDGYATILALMPDNKWCFYKWDYGSCLACDEWESRGLTDQEIEKEMLANSIFMTEESMTNWFDIENEKKGAFRDMYNHFIAYKALTENSK